MWKLFVLEGDTWKVELLLLNNNTWNYLTKKIELLVLYSNAWNHLTEWKQRINSKWNY